LLTGLEDHVHFGKEYRGASENTQQTMSQLARHGSPPA